jgi:hypothetical protein
MEGIGSSSSSSSLATVTLIFGEDGMGCVGMSTCGGVAMGGKRTSPIRDKVEGASLFGASTTGLLWWFLESSGGAGCKPSGFRIDSF